MAAARPDTPAAHPARFLTVEHACRLPELAEARSQAETALAGYTAAWREMRAMGVANMADGPLAYLFGALSTRSIIVGPRRSWGSWMQCAAHSPTVRRPANRRRFIGGGSVWAGKSPTGPSS
jgi:hypothetical protein